MVLYDLFILPYLVKNEKKIDSSLEAATILIITKTKSILKNIFIFLQESIHSSQNEHQNNQNNTTFLKKEWFQWIIDAMSSGNSGNSGTGTEDDDDENSSNEK